MERENSNMHQDPEVLETAGLENYNRLDDLLEQYTIPLNILSALANSYHTMHLIDIKTNTVVEINSTLDVRRFQNPILNADQQIKQVLDNVILKSDRERVLGFMDLKTLPERLRGKRFLSTEYVGLFSGWGRATFVPIEFDNQGLATSVILYSRVIDQEKKREENLIRTTNIDELTGLNNRHSFEETLKTLESKAIRDDLVLVSMDVNSLKETNDKYGHGEGDKLLKGAADCMKDTIGKFGNVYRTGGDEFVAIINLNVEELDALKGSFKRVCNKWSKKNGLYLAVSAGYISRANHKNYSIRDLIKQADQRMYRDKARFYDTHGYDRRNNQSVYFSICKSYSKIEKINLNDETHEIVYMDYSEKEIDFTLSLKYSAWLKKFVRQGYIHSDDIELFNSIFNIENLRKHFDEEKSIIKASYRRRIKDEYKRLNLEIIPDSNYGKLNNRLIYVCLKVCD